MSSQWTDAPPSAPHTPPPARLEMVQPLPPEHCGFWQESAVIQLSLPCWYSQLKSDVLTSLPLVLLSFLCVPCWCWFLQVILYETLLVSSDSRFRPFMVCSGTILLWFDKGIFYSFWWSPVCWFLIYVLFLFGVCMCGLKLHPHMEIFTMSLRKYILLTFHLVVWCHWP